jgi:hypothetical protein
MQWQQSTSAGCRLNRTNACTHSQAIFVQGNFLDEILALDCQILVVLQVEHHNVRHRLAVRIPTPTVAAQHDERKSGEKGESNTNLLRYMPWTVLNMRW